MATSLVYRSPLVYELIMAALYGRHYPARYSAIAELVPAGCSVLELCCGPGFLYERHLRSRQTEYTGLDCNPRFVARVRRLGAAAEVWDLHSEKPLPRANIVILQASLYHFLPNPAPLVQRMMAAAEQHVIISEPVRNLSNSKLPLVAALAARHTNAGFGSEPQRFDERSLAAFFESLGLQPSRSFPIPGGRELVFLFEVRTQAEPTMLPPGGRGARECP